MKVSDVRSAGEPTRTPTGEVIFELIGRGEGHGGVEGHSLAHVIIPGGKSSEKHFHRESEETYYILGGVGEMVIEGKEFELHPGQACLIEPGETHQIFNRQEEDLVFLAVSAPAWAADDFHEGSD